MREGGSRYITHHTMAIVMYTKNRSAAPFWMTCAARCSKSRLCSTASPKRRPHNQPPRCAANETCSTGELKNAMASYLRESARGGKM